MRHLLSILLIGIGAWMLTHFPDVGVNCEHEMVFHVWWSVGLVVAGCLVGAK
jgi:hypothetical protein